MDFVVLILALIAYFLVGVMPSTHYDGWFYGLKSKSQQWFQSKRGEKAEFPSGSKPLGLIVLGVSVILPVVGLSLLISWFEQLILGIPAFFLSVAILLYSLGRKEHCHWFKRFQIAWRQGDIQGAYRYANEILPEHHPNTETELYNRIYARLLYVNFTQYFTVIFWFVLLGAEGAMLARLTQLFSQPVADDGNKLSGNAQLFVVLIEWLPARLLGLVMVILSQSFRGLNEWLKQLLMFKSSLQNKTEEKPLYRMVLCVLGEKLQYQDSGDALYLKSRFSEQKEEGLKNLADLLQRSAILSVIVYSIWVLLS